MDSLTTTVSMTPLLTPQDESGRCTLLSGPFESCVQVALGMIAMSVLVVKRWTEIPRRPLGVWLFDASKQAIGAGVAHAANIAIAIALVGYTDTGTTDECAMYFVNFSLDTSLGVVFNWMLLTLVTTAAKRMRWTALQTPGDYGDPVRVRVWLLQLLSWLGVILTAKLLIGRGIVYFQAGLVAYAAWVFAPLEGHPRVELIVVMVACPCLMNALQFWVQDSFLKKKTKYDLLPRTDKGHGKHHAGYHEYDVSDAPPSPPPYSLQSASLHHHPHHPSR